MPAFSDLTSQFLAEEYAARPVMASGLGLTEYDDQLDDQSEAAFEARAAASASWLERFEQVPAGDLDFDEAIDRDLLIASLKERPYKGDTALRDAAVSSFSFYKRVFEKDYMDILQIKK